MLKKKVKVKINFNGRIIFKELIKGKSVWGASLNGYFGFSIRGFLILPSCPSTNIKQGEGVR